MCGLPVGGEELVGWGDWFARSAGVNLIEREGWLNLDASWWLMVCESLAWPLVSLVVILVFRRDLSAAFQRVGRVKYRELEVTFRTDLDRAEALAKTMVSKPEVRPEAHDLLGRPPGSVILESQPAEGLGGLNSSADLVLLDLAEVAPVEAMAAAWTRLARTRSTGKVSRATTKEQELMGLLDEIREKASWLKAEQAPSALEARRYLSLACPLASRIGAR